MRRAVDGLGDLMDDYEFHYPGELNPDNLDEVRDALDGHGIATVCTGLHTDARFGKGGLTSVDAATRAEARRLTRETAEMAGAVGANMICWPGIEGYNYPFQTPYAQSWEWFVEGMAEAADRARHLHRGGFAGVLGLVAARDEPGHHRPEGPDSERGLHVGAPSSSQVRAA